MAIDINSKHALAVDARQLRRERKAYRQRIGVAQGLQKKLDSLEFNSRPLRLDNQEYMLLRMLLAGDVHVQGRVVQWIDARLRELMTSLPTRAIAEAGLR